MATGVRELAERVHSMAIHLLRRVRAADVELGLSASRLSALSVLVFGGPRGVGELARAEQVSAPTMSRLVTALEREGLVERKRDPGDARRVRVEATPAGERALLAASARRVDRMSELMRGMGPAARESVLEAVQILEIALERADDEGES